MNRIAQITKLVRDIQEVHAVKQKKKKKKGQDVVKSISSSKMAAPVAIEYKVVKHDPVIKQKAGITCISHFELVDGIITTTSNFSNAANLPIQPAFFDTFPWLSRMGVLFKKYRFKKLNFIYIPFCSSATAGTIEMGVDFDAANPSPAIEQNFSDYSSYTQGNVWQKLICKIDCAKLNLDHPWRLTRPVGYVGQLSQLANYDAGNFFLFTNNGASVNCGKLYVDYEIELSEPTLPPNGVLFGTSTKSTSGTTPANPFGTGILTVANGSVGVQVNPPGSASGNSVLAFNGPGIYMASFLINGTTLASLNTGSLSGYTLPGWTELTNVSNSTATQMEVSGYFNVVDDQSQIAISVSAAAVSGAWVNVSQTSFTPQF